MPHALLEAWGDVEEAEIEQHAGARIIKPKPNTTSHLQAQIVIQMSVGGLIENLPWANPQRLSTRSAVVSQ